MKVCLHIYTSNLYYRTSDPPELHYNASLYENTENSKDDNKLGPQVIHKYNIKNEGPFTVDETEIYFMWPYQTLEGKIENGMKIFRTDVGLNMKKKNKHKCNSNIRINLPY